MKKHRHKWYYIGGNHIIGEVYHWCTVCGVLRIGATDFSRGKNFVKSVSYRKPKGE